MKEPWVLKEKDSCRRGEMFSSGKKPVNVGEELYLRPEDGCLLAGEIRF